MLKCCIISKHYFQDCGWFHEKYTVVNSETFNTSRNRCMQEKQSKEPCEIFWKTPKEESIFDELIE